MRKKIFLFAFVALITAVSIFSNPVISNVSVQTVYGTSVVITWTTDVASTSRVTYGTSTPPSNIEENLNYVTEHRVAIEGLSICTPYFFSVTSNDGQGATTDDNNGSYYTFNTGLDTQPVYNAVYPQVPKTIPILETVTSTITVSENKPIEDINVTIGEINIGIAWPLNIYLISPDNTRILLSRNNSTDNQNSNFYNMILDDEADEYLTNQSAPFTGVYKPNGQLNHLYGKNAQGTWTLEITNTVEIPDNDAELVSWSISFTFPYEYCSPHAKIVSYSVDDNCTGTGYGGENGIIDSGEDIILPVTIYNDGSGDLTNVSATATTSTNGITILNGNVSFPNVSKNSSVQSSTSSSFSVNVSKSCGDPILLNFHIVASQKPSGWDVPLTLHIGYSPEENNVVLDEDFTYGIDLPSSWPSGTPDPSKWWIVDGGTGGGAAATWTDVNVTPRNEHPLANDPFAMVDSDYAGEEAEQDEELWTPVFNFSNALTVTLEYDTIFAYFEGGLEETGDVDVKSSLTSGEWVNIKRYQSQSTPSDWENDPAVHETIDITDYAAGANDVQIRFHYYNAQWEFFWLVDNIKISYTVNPSCSMDRCCPTMTTPSITNITDNNLCSQSGVTITFTSSTPATRHDLYVDNTLVQSDVASPINYNPGDKNQHSYKIRAVNYYEDCYIESTASNFTDEDRTPETPSAPTVQDPTPCATAGVSITWGAVSQATYYDLLVDGTTTVSNVTTPYTYEPHDNSSHTYQIRGRNDDCTGQWSSSTSGTDENHTPATPSTAPTVSDKDACQTNGVNITWSTVSGATGYDLRVDGTTIVENVTSPYTYLPNNNTQHSYEIRGKYVNASPSYTCYGGWSPSQNGTDINDTPGQPAITSITDNDACATSGIT
ncbi:MAG: proprotein convertase P-domain-containing protein, partial [Acidobacteriota bacterium]